jgi:hypothetical protein
MQSKLRREAEQECSENMNIDGNIAKDIIKCKGT